MPAAEDKPERAELVIVCSLVARSLLETGQQVLYKTMRLMHPSILLSVMVCLMNNFINLFIWFTAGI